MNNNKERINLDNKTILVTGAAGFIGYHLIRRLLKEYVGVTIIGFDSFTDYYDVGLKEYRIRQIEEICKECDSDWYLIRGSIANRDCIKGVFRKFSPQIIVNMAAQAGVRYSIENPDSYIESNIIGFYNVLEACRDLGEKVEHFVFASSSSVYGGNTKVPFSTEDNVDHPVSLYAATKKSDELMAFCYSKLYNIPSTGLRFFTVYGPAGRPDMAYYSFTEKLRAGEKINIFNFGNCRRDFTYIDDIIEGVIRVMHRVPVKNVGDDGLPVAPYCIYNIGNSHPENLMDFVYILSEELISAELLDRSFSVEDHLNLLPMQAGDVPVTYADTEAFERDFGFKPTVDLRTGLRDFVQWYSDYCLGKKDNA